MHQTTQLASGLINGHDRLTIELVEPANLPATILLRWPQKPSAGPGRPRRPVPPDRPPENARTRGRFAFRSIKKGAFPASSFVTAAPITISTEATSPPWSG